MFQASFTLNYFLFAENFERICEHCGEAFGTMYKLQVHQAKFHVSEAIEACPICQEEFEAGNPIRLHIEVEHIKPTIVEEIYDGRKSKAQTQTE